MNTPRVIGRPGKFDRRVRALVQDNLPAGTARAMSPLFPLGLPIGYIPISYATAHWLYRRGRFGGPAIVTAAWVGWLSQWGIKKLVVRARPRRPRVKGRFESFPSGHTTGTTATALTMAYVLHRERVLSKRNAMLLAVGAPLVMGAYRVIDDEHWATDVIAGWALGSAIAVSCCALLADRRGVVLPKIRGAAESSSASPRPVRSE